MTSNSGIVALPSRLDEPGRVLIFSQDEAVAFALPILLAAMVGKLILGIVLGVVVWRLWKMLRGENGLEAMLALAYWYLPPRFLNAECLPPSRHQFWRA